MKKAKYIVLGLLLVSAIALGLCACDYQSPHNPAWLFRNCNTCHAGQAQNSSYDHSGLTNDDCYSCHKDTEKVVISHADYTANDCASCHEKDMPANHSAYKAADCELCHSIGQENVTTIDFSKKPFDHTGYTSAQAALCHNGDYAVKLPANTSVPDHSSYTAEKCSYCHTGDFANAIPSDSSHEGKTVDDCASCHNIGEAVPQAGVDHTAFTGDDCATCHNGTDANALPDDHAAYKTNMCTMCHTW